MGGPSPWHLWGNSIQVNIDSATSTLPGRANTQQLVRVAYGRPDTWRFLLASTLISASDTSLSPWSGEQVDILVRFHLQVGIGRAMLSIPDWAVIRWSYQPTPPSNETLWTSFARDRYADIKSTLSTPTPVDQIVAQDLQLSAEINVLTAATHAVSASLAVQAFFAPSTHYRPDWAAGLFEPGVLEAR